MTPWLGRIAALTKELRHGAAPAQPVKTLEGLYKLAAEGNGLYRQKETAPGT